MMKKRRPNVSFLKDEAILETDNRLIEPKDIEFIATAEDNYRLKVISMAEYPEMIDINDTLSVPYKYYSSSIMDSKDVLKPDSISPDLNLAILDTLIDNSWLTVPNMTYKMYFNAFVRGSELHEGINVFNIVPLSNLRNYGVLYDSVITIESDINPMTLMRFHDRVEKVYILSTNVKFPLSLKLPILGEMFCLQ